MISVGTYVKILLKKRNMTQADLVRKIQEVGFTKGVNLPHINNIINGTEKTPHYSLLRKIEIALDLPEYSLIKIAGNPSEAEWERIKEIKANETDSSR